MASRISLWLLAFLFLQCLIGAGLEAQTCSAGLAQASCGWYSFDSGCLPPLPPGAFNCSQSGGWSWTCRIATNQCHAICWDCLLGTPSGGEPINLATGDTFIMQSDLSIPGLGGGLSLSRTWHSQFPFTEAVPTSGMFGGNWRSTYEDLIYVGPQGLVKYVRGTGGIWTLGLAASGSGETGWANWSYSMIAPANGNISLTYDQSLTGSAAYWTLSFNTGEKRIFTVNCAAGPPTNCTSVPTDPIGYLTAIIDRNGNTTQLTYDAFNRLTTVTDPASRHLYFSYAPSSNLVVGVSSDVGISLSYAYDTQWRLATVTKPDSTTVSYQYDANSMIAAVLDTNGKVLEGHTYDSESRGVTSSRAGGVDAMTITYPFLILGELP